jgi:sec-independent protein translocase protein TatA
MPSIGPLEAGVILAIVLIVFGVGRLPEIGGAMGKAIREFRQASSGVDEKTANQEETAEKT